MISSVFEKSHVAFPCVGDSGVLTKDACRRAMSVGSVAGVLCHGRPRRLPSVALFSAGTVELRPTECRGQTARAAAAAHGRLLEGHRQVSSKSHGNDCNIGRSSVKWHRPETHCISIAL